MYYGVAPAVPKGSKLAPFVSQLIRKYKESGRMDQIKKKWMLEKCSHGVDHNDRLDIYVFGGIVTSTIAFMILSFGILVVEIYTQKRISRKIKSSKLSQFSHRNMEHVEKDNISSVMKENVIRIEK